MSLRLVALIAVSFPLSISVASEARDPCEAPPSLMRQFGISYKETLRQAYAHKERGLVVLFRLSTSSDLDGMWAECYASDIRKLLDVWGDNRFATILRRQSPRVQKAVSRTLREIGFAEQLSNRYPESFGAIAATAASPNYAKLILGAWRCHIPGKTGRIVIFHSDGSWGVPFSIASRPEDWQREDTEGRRWRVEGDKLMIESAAGGRLPEERIVSFGDTAFETEVNGIRISYTRTKVWPRKSPDQSMKPRPLIQMTSIMFATNPARDLSLSR